MASNVEVFPAGRLFRPVIADPREIKMALSLLNDGYLNAAVGNYFSIVGITSHDADTHVHAGIEGAGFFTMRQEDQRFPLETTDGLIGLYAEIKWKSVTGQLRYTHISAHLADGSDSYHEPIAYSRETLSVRVKHEFTAYSEIYAGIYGLAHSIPVLPPWSFQLGGAFFLPLDNQMVVPFLATDLRWRQESTPNPSWNLQLGIALNETTYGKRSFRIYYGYYTGVDPRGQFYRRSLTSHSIGLEMQI